MALLRVPGGMGPEDYDPLDMKAAIQAGKYQRGFAMIQTDGTFQMLDIDPGEYIIEIPRLPQNMMDMDAYSRMDRTPRYRATIQVTDKGADLEFEMDLNN